MIKIRLQRHGARHAPFYRMVVTPSTTRRDGKFIEVLGTYNPQAHARTEELKLKMERIDHWLGVGAQPTDTAKSLIRQGRLTPEEWLKRSEREAANRLKRAQKGSVTPTMEASPESKVEEAKKEQSEAPAEEKAQEEKVKKEEPEMNEEEAKAKEEKPAEEVKKAEPESPAEEKAKEEKPEVKEEEAKAKEEKLAEEVKKEESEVPAEEKAKDVKSEVKAEESETEDTKPAEEESKADDISSSESDKEKEEAKEG